MAFSVGTLKHEKLRDVHTPHWLADLEAAVCSETEADSRIATHKGDASSHHAKTTDAGDIASGRFGMTRMPDMASGKIMVGQGAGNNPVEEDKPAAGLVFTEMKSSSHYPSTGDWEDWDLSGIVPSGTKYVLVFFTNRDSINHQDMGARKNGSTVDRYAYMAVEYGAVMALTEVDANRIIEIKGTGGSTNMRFQIWGYWS